MTQVELANVRELLRDSQIKNFLGSADALSDRPTTVLIVNQALTKGKTLDEVLCENVEVHVPPRYRFVMTMSTEQLGPNTFRIHFRGANKNFGDGGTWCVEYGPNDEVTRLTVEEYWSK